MDVKLAPVHRRTVADEVFDQLSGHIVRGDLGCDEALPAERALSDQLGVNRQAIRETLQRLAQAGLVDVHHGGVTRVRDYRRTAGLDLLPRLLAGVDGTPDPSVIRSVMELRATLGPDIAARCAERATSATIERLADAWAALQEAPGSDPVARATADLDYWEALVDGADNVAYRLAFNSLRAVYEPVIPQLAPVLADEVGDLADHEAIVVAVRAGDPPAAQDAAWALLARGTEAITRLLGALDGAPETS